MANRVTGRRKYLAPISREMLEKYWQREVKQRPTTPTVLYQRTRICVALQASFLMEHSSESFGLPARAIVSTPPPAPNGSIVRTGFVGESCEPCSITPSVKTNPKNIRVDTLPS